MTIMKQSSFLHYHFGGMKQAYYAEMQPGKTLV